MQEIQAGLVSLYRHVDACILYWGNIRQLRDDHVDVPKLYELMEVQWDIQMYLSYYKYR